MDDGTPSTRRKALALNLDPVTYGAFAEAGGGQEVARWFFEVGGAAGTVAKTISAYDMAMAIRRYDEGYLSIRTPDVLARIEAGDDSWGSHGTGSRGRHHQDKETLRISDLIEPNALSKLLAPRTSVKRSATPNLLAAASINFQRAALAG